MKRFTKLSIVLSLILLFTSCGAKPTSNSGTVTETTTQETTVTTEKAEPQVKPLLSNGKFDGSSVEPWYIFTQGGFCEKSVKDGKLTIDIKDTGTLDYGVQLYQDCGKLETGCKYLVKFDVSSTIPRQAEFRIQINGGDYHAYVSKVLDLASDTKTESIEFDMTESSDPAPRLAFNLGLPKGADAIAPHQITFSNISFELIDDSNKIKVEEAAPMPDINIDQLGYLPDDKKVAIFRGDNVDKSFELIDTKTNKSVFTGDITGSNENKSAGETNYYGDFSSFKTEGTYLIKTKNLGESYKFQIGKDVYNNAYGDVVKMLYLQRCGTELTKDLAGDFAHPVCHNTQATIFGTNTKLDVSGGWHDAGDYGRYVVAGAKTVADLLLSYNNNPSSFADNSGIPESGNKVPDILDEAKYELSWLLKMQDKTSGGVYHKVSCANFPKDVLPNEETEPLIISPISYAATADFAAVMAMSSSYYKQYDAAFAKKCLDAAEKAYAYLETDKYPSGFTNPEGIVTGEYGDSQMTDEKYWSSVELYKATGNKKYHDAVIAQVSSYVPVGFGWADMGYYGSVAYLTMPTDKTDKATYDKIKSSYFDEVNKIVANSKKDGYLISIGNSYPWGSNLSVANNAMQLLIADKIQPNPEYKQIVKDHLHYCFGRNPMSTCYVTGYGTISPLHPHHRPSTAISKAMPGMIVGGPDSNLEDPFAKAVLADTPAAKCYVDNVQSFSTNEITIYWNSPLIFVMSGLK